MKKLLYIIRRKYYFCFWIAILFLIIHYSGFFIYLEQNDLNDIDFSKLLGNSNLTDILKFYHQEIDSQKTKYNFDLIKNKANSLYEIKSLENFNEKFIIKNENKCIEQNNFKNVRLIIIVKSFILNRYRRDVIRKSWGNEKRFSDVNIKTLFTIGSCESITNQDLEKLNINDKRLNSCQDYFDDENEKNQDLIQIDYIDNYYNNTIKTINGLKWVVENCPKSDFVLLIDDDYYLSLKNLLKFMRWLNYDEEEKKIFENQINYAKTKIEKFYLNKIPEKFDPYKEDLYCGYVFSYSTPCRYRLSKWFVNLEEYPFTKWPSYVTGGFILLSNKSFKSIYIASLYTKKFRFDDIYLSILAKRINIKTLNNENVYFKKKYYNLNSDEYSDTIASHGFNDIDKMFELWFEMKSKGWA